MNIKKLVLTLALLGMTVAVQAAEGKFAFIDVQKIFTEADAAKAAQTSLSKKQAQYKKELEAMGESLQKLNEDLKQSTTTDTATSDKAKQFQTKREEYSKKLADYEKRLTDERNSVRDNILKALKQASQTIAKEKGYAAVLSSNQSMYYDEELDVTADALARVNAAVK